MGGDAGDRDRARLMRRGSARGPWCMGTKVCGAVETIMGGAEGPPGRRLRCWRWPVPFGRANARAGTSTCARHATRSIVARAPRENPQDIGGPSTPPMLPRSAQDDKRKGRRWRSLRGSPVLGTGALHHAQVRRINSPLRRRRNCDWALLTVLAVRLLREALWRRRMSWDARPSCSSSRGRGGRAGGRACLYSRARGRFSGGRRHLRG